MGSLGTSPIAKAKFRSRTRLFVSIGLIAAILYLQLVHLPSRLFKQPESVVRLSEAQLRDLEEGLQKCRDAQSSLRDYPLTAPSRENPRWNPISGQNTTVLLRNATLFNGKNFASDPVDIVFTKGVITSVSASASSDITVTPQHAIVVDLHGKYITPGLVDMHSHHLAISWPSLATTVDDNEVHPETGPLTPFVRSLDGMKPYDTATAQIASGGVTSSLVLPGSANIMGGEAYPVKNIVAPGENGEEVIEEMLLEYGIPKKDRRRYLKMACGENPKRVYHHTRMGNAWKFRQHMERAQNLLKQQDAWCLSAAAARDTADGAAISQLLLVISGKGGFPEDLELDSTVAMLRGKINVNIHCYEVEDFEDMLRHSEEFGFRISAFHHALSAWKVPEMIKASAQNITIATFSDFGLYKKEAYDANLYAGKILAKHGVPVAYKSDHVHEGTSAKYLLFQAANAHSFGLPEDLALQSVTSVPAASMQLDHRIGYVKAGYDADLVVWDSHPLSLGATPLQVYIDGRETLDTDKVKDSLSKKVPTKEVPKMRPPVEGQEEICNAVQKAEKVVVTGISRSYLPSPWKTAGPSDNMTIVLEAGKVSCLGSFRECAHAYNTDDITIQLQDGHILPGLTAYTTGLGLVEIEDESETGDGNVDAAIDPLNPNNVIYAKYGIHPDGRSFERARIGGVTRAITAPLKNKGFLHGVSVGFKTAGNFTNLDEVIFQEDVALHFSIGQISRASTSTISSAVAKLRKILTDHKNKDNIYGLSAKGKIPLLVDVQSKYDILQMIKIKKDFPSINLVLVGAPDAYLVAEELAKHSIPVIVTSHRGHPDSFEKRDALSGPPLTKSLVRILDEAGVKLALSNYGEGGGSFIHNLLHEASWAAQYAGLSDDQAVSLVSSNLEEILGLKRSTDMVVYEGNPLQYGASVVLGVDGDGRGVVQCWPFST